MNEQDIINRLTRIEALLEDISARLQPTVTVVPQIARPHNWPWGYRLASVNMECGAVGSTADPVSTMGANGSAK